MMIVFCWCELFPARQARIATG